MAKFSCQLTEILVGKTEISVTEPGPLIWTHRKFTKDLEVRRDFGNRASPVNRAHMKRPLKSDTEFLNLYLGNHGKHEVIVVVVIIFLFALFTQYKKIYLQRLSLEGEETQSMRSLLINIRLNS